MADDRVSFRFRQGKDDDLKDAVDKVCEKTGLERTSLIRLALRSYLKEYLKKEKADSFSLADLMDGD